MLHRGYTQNNVPADELKCGKRIPYSVGCWARSKHNILLLSAMDMGTRICMPQSMGIVNARAGDTLPASCTPDRLFCQPPLDNVHDEFARLSHRVWLPPYFDQLWSVCAPTALVHNNTCARFLSQELHCRALASDYKPNNGR